MKPQYKKSYVRCVGVDRRLNPRLGTANNIINCRWDEETGWKGDVGYESWWKFPDNFQMSSASQITTYFESQVDSVYQWTRADSNDTYTFVEQNGELYYLTGNKGQGQTYTSSTWIADRVVVDSKRHIPKLGDIGTQYINLGKQLLIINGYDRALIFSGDRKWRDFGFTSATGTPQILKPDTDYVSGGGMQDGIAIWFDEKSIFGMGATDGTHNQYGWKITYINELGAESPLSSPNYTSWWISQGGSKKKYAVGLDIPIGPEGTVARRLYRTKNITDNGEVYYFVKELKDNSQRWCVDYFSDRMLVNTAPSQLDSVPIISNFKFGDVWDGRLWLAKGNKVWYSNRGLMEQFGGADYFDVSNLTGGDITGVKAYYNNLFIFRQTAINVISTNGTGYSISTVNSTIGTTASNAIVSVPNLGVMFINEDGVYILNGGLNGGATVKLTAASFQIDKFLKIMNKSLIHKTIAAYSPKDREVWFHWTDVSNTVPNIGIVFHTNMEIPQWSFRGAPDNDELVYFSAMTTTTDGRFLLGNKPTWFGDPAKGGIAYNFGPLSVQSRCGTAGQVATFVSNEDGLITWAMTDGPRLGSVWESTWYSFDDTSASHRVYSVELELLSMGDNPFTFEYGKDFEFELTTTGDQKQANPRTVFTTKEWSVFGPADVSITKVPFTVGQSQITDRQIIRLRYDVNTELRNQFKFSIKSESQFHLLGFNLLYDTVEIPVINGNARAMGR